MLTDQGTFCLSTSHRFCHRFVAAQAAQGRRQPLQTEHVSTTNLNSEDFSAGLEEIEREIESNYRAERSSRRQWGWIGAGMIFVSSILCGGIFAAYVGWQLANSTLAVSPQGSLDTLASAAAPRQAQVYLIVTATFTPEGAVPSNASAAAPPEAQQEPFAFPEAVTATPVPQNVAPLVGPTDTTGINANGGTVLGLPSVEEPPADQTAAQPAINVQLEVPTRRPTPVIDIQAPVVEATPEPTATPAPTATPTPQLGTPSVIFAAEDRELMPGECTKVIWHVENVRAVYYENIGVNGHGEKEECLDDRNGEFLLTIVTGDGSTRYYTTTVRLVQPTDTPEPTRTFTPEPVATPTWTPNVPSPTPTPAPQYGVRIAVEGGNAADCAPGTTCEVGLLISNTGTAMDNILVLFDNSGLWPYQLCRLDGVCSNSSITLVNVSPGNTAYLLLKVEVPDGSASQSESYVVRAISESSEGASVADIANVEIRSQ